MLFRELLGTAGSLLVMLSYFFNGMRLRIVNIIGSIIFIIYGVMLGGISIVILNGITIPIHLYYTMKEVKDNGRKAKQIRNDSRT